MSTFSRTVPLSLISLVSVLTISSCALLFPDFRASICINSFNDLNGDGMYQDGKEPPLPGWTFNIVNGNQTTQKTTNAKGFICFEASAPSTVTITEVPQTGWAPSFPSAQARIVSVDPHAHYYFYFGNKHITKG